MFLFILCSLSGWLCELPKQPLPTVVAVQSIELGEGFIVMGNPWNDLSDPGYCGVGIPSGSGNPPALSWPVPPNLNENRGFRVGHPAIDLYANEGDAVLAAASGVIVWSGFSSFGGGNVVVISHGSFYSAYFHLSEVLVSCGKWVGVGSVIGLVGMSGASNFFHLHFYLGNGNRAYDPIPHLP